MKTIDTKQTIKDLKGESIKVGSELLTVGIAVSNLLAAKKGPFDTMKAWVLAQRFYNDASVEVDDADLEKLKSVVDLDESFTVLVKGQLLQALTA